MFSGRLFVLLFCFNYALCLQKKLCNDDDDCFINAVIDRVYPMLMAGVPGVEPTDPLRLDAIVADLSHLRYALYNATLTGSKNCEFIHFNSKHVSVYKLFEYVLTCPLLTVQGEYDLNGIIDSEPLEGKGSCKIIYEDYQITITGKNEQVKDSKGRPHVHILEYKVTPELKGEVKYVEYMNLVKNHRACDDRMKNIEKMTRDVTMDVFMNKYMQNLKKLHHQIPIEQLHFKYVR